VRQVKRRRRSSDAIRGCLVIVELERIIHAFTEGDLRIHKLCARVRADDIDESVRALLEEQTELAKKTTSRLQQQQILYGSIDGRLTGLQARIGELLAIEDVAEQESR
jgi:hypothetical protein